MDKEIDFQNDNMLFDMMKAMVTHTMENPIIQKFIRDPNQKFDVVIGEWMFNEFYSV